MDEEARDKGGDECGGGAELQSRYLAKAEPLLLKQIYDAITGNRP